MDFGLWTLDSSSAVDLAQSFEYRPHLNPRAARDWLAETTHIAEADVILMGVSLGGAVAVNLAASEGARGLVLASTIPGP